jgi:TonB-linked SusC/RagA family outer membrane protein
MEKRMYHVFLILFLSLLAASPSMATVQQKNIEIEAMNEPLASVLKRLEKLTSYKMMYANEDVFGVKVNKIIKAPTVEKALDQILEGTGLSYTIDKQFVTIRKASAGSGEAFIMNGHVYDESGLDVPGVTVMILGTSEGAATDVDGRFSLKVRAGQKLRFTYIGYKEVVETVKPIHNRKIMKVTITPDARNLEEVQVVAFGTQKKESVVSSITTVNPGDLKSSSSDLTTAFAGKIPGMIAWQTGGMPGALSEEEMNTKFYVRGITSFQSGANTDPLILLDGVESSKLDLSRIAVEDIESFSVLKDASATAMYGARGANGVIMVTTKKGQEGSVYTTTRYECVVSTPTKEIDVVDPIDYMKYYNQALLGRSNTSSPKYTQERIARTGNPNYPSWLYPANDWYDILFKNQTVNHRAGISIRGGSQKVQYYASFNYNRDEGMLKSDKLNDFDVNITNNQFNFRTNLTIELNAGIQLQINSATNIDRYHGPVVDQTSAYYYAFNASPVDFAPVYPADETYSWPHIRYGTTAAKATNPYMLNQQGYVERTRYSTTNRAEFIHKLNRWVKGLEYRLIASIVQSGYYNNTYTTIPYKYYLSNYDFETGKHTLTPDPDNQTASKTLTVMNYGKIHSTDTRTTFEGRIYHTAAWGGPDKNMHQTAFTGVAQLYERTFTPIETVLNGLPQRNATFSGRFSYGLFDRYFFEGSAAYNGSERFSKDHRWGFFPSVGTAWVASSEPWMKKLRKYISYLKFRFSWGKVGNDGIISTPRYVYLQDIGVEAQPMFNNGVKSYDNIQYRRNIVNFYGNPDIKWEIAEQTNLGIEAKFFGGLFETQVDIYREIRHNILSYRYNIPANVGIEVNPLDNIGETDSRGVDLSAKIQHMFNNDFWFILNGTLTYNKVKYKYIEEATGKPEWQLKKGHEISQAMGYIAEGLFRDQNEIDNSPRQDGDVMPGDIKYRDINGDNKIDVNDAVFIGYPETPRLIYGLSLFVNYKQFEFSTSFQGSGKRSFFIDAQSISPFYKDHAMLQAIADSHWSEDNQADRPFWPRLSVDNIVVHNPQEDWTANAETRKSTYFMRSCSFLRCTSISLAYNLPQRFVHRLGLKNVKFTLSTNNPFCFTSFKLWDVELGSDGFNYPIQKTFSASINVNF